MTKKRWGWLRTDGKKEKKQTGESPANRSILRITYGIALLFLALILYVGYFIQIQGPEVINNSYNARLDRFSDRVHRGRSWRLTVRFWLTMRRMRMEMSCGFTTMGMYLHM